MSFTANKVLIVESETNMLKTLEATLEEYVPIHVALSEAQAIASMQNEVFIAVIIDLDTLGTDGTHLLNYVARQHPDTLRICRSERTRAEIGGELIDSCGAFLVPGHPTEAMLNTLRASTSQRKTIISLRQLLDTNSELLDLDRRLHPDLDPYELAERAAKEMACLPEIKAAAVYFYNENGEALPPHPVKGDPEFHTPDLSRSGSSTVTVDDDQVFTLRIGDLTSPKAAIAVQFPSSAPDVLRFLEFVGRHVQQTYRISKRIVDSGPRAPSMLSADPLQGESNNTPGTVNASHVSDALTTPSTVFASTADALRRIVKTLAPFGGTNETLGVQIGELKEITIDLKMASDVMSRLLDRLKLIQNDKGISE